MSSWEAGQYAKVWAWEGRVQELTTVYLGRTSTTGEHVFCEPSSGKAFILGRHVFDTEEHARWWALGQGENAVLAMNYHLDRIKGGADV